MRSNVLLQLTQPRSFRFTNSGLPAMQVRRALLRDSPCLSCISSTRLIPRSLLPVFCTYVLCQHLLLNALTPSQEVAAALLSMGGGGGGGRGGGRGRGGTGFDRGGLGRGGPPGHQGGGGGGGMTSINPSQLRKLNEILRNAKFTVTHRRVTPVTDPGEADFYKGKPRGFSPCGLLPLSRLRILSFCLPAGTAVRTGWSLWLPTSKVDMFKLNVSQFITVAEQYNVTVTKPQLPCVAYGQKNYVP